MTVYLDKQPVRLLDSSLIASGGEGSAYKVGKDVYKIYHKPLDLTFLDKMRELSALVSLPNVAVPERPVFDKEGRLVGYVMRQITDPLALPLLFTTSYLKRNGITIDSLTRLSSRMADTVAKIHDAKILVVDMNEFNLLVKNVGTLEPFFIDVDSYQTPSFPATAIMPSIQDFATKDFNELTDWYSFGVLAFQLFVGIHPYKGGVTGFADDDIAARCKAHVSVLNPKTTYPRAAVRPFDSIPRGYLAWFQAMFEGGERLPPPADPGALSVRAPDATIVSAQLNILKEWASSSEILDLRRIAGRTILSTRGGVQMDGSTMAKGIEVGTGHVFPLMGDRGMIAVFIRDGYVWAKLDTNGGELRSDVPAEKLFFVDDRLYSIYRGVVQEVGATTLGGNTQLITYTPMNVLKNASKVMTGVVYMDIFGRPNFLIPYGFKLSTIFHSADTDGYKIIDAFYMNGTLIVVGSNNGRYDRFTFKFINGSGLALVDHDVERDVLLEEVNATVLSNGMLVEVVAGDLRLSARSSVQKKIVKDVGLPAGASLRNDGAKVYYILGHEAFSITLASHR